MAGGEGECRPRPRNGDGRRMHSLHVTGRRRSGQRCCLAPGGFGGGQTHGGAQASLTHFPRPASIALCTASGMAASRKLYDYPWHTASQPLLSLLKRSSGQLWDLVHVSRADSLLQSTEEEREGRAAGTSLLFLGGGRVHSHVAVTELVKNISINKTNKQHIH